jgi:hypothetical protein
LLETSTLKEGADVAGREKARGNTEPRKKNKDVASTALGRKGTVIHH